MLKVRKQSQSDNWAETWRDGEDDEAQPSPYLIYYAVEEMFPPDAPCESEFRAHQLASPRLTGLAA